ncbi:MAG: hypothetical protein ABWK01_07335 [Infirmifilum sp.]
MGLKRAGLIFYAERVYSVVVGALFILIITRNLTPSDYGAWSVISSILSYAALATIINYWITRFRARGDTSALISGLLLSIGFSLVAITALFFLSRDLSTLFNVPYNIILLSIAYIPFYYVNSALYSDLYAVNPSRAAVTEFIFESFKLLAALFFMAVSRISLFTALLAVLAGHVGQSLSLLFFTRSDLVHKPRLDTIKRILLYSWVNALGLPASIVAMMDVPLISHFLSNTVVAYYTVVLTYSNLIGYSYVLGKGLYPSLLSSQERVEEKLEETLKLTLLLGVPTAVGAIILAPNLLYLFKPDYTAASQVLQVASIAALIGVVNGVLSDTLQGVESIDTNNVHPKELKGSLIFKITLIGLTRAVLGIVGVGLVILLFKDGVTAAVLARLSWLLAEVFVLARLYLMSRVYVRLKPVFSSVARYLAAAIPMSVVAVWINPWRIREALLAVFIGAVVYFATLYVIDSWFRSLVRLVLRELGIKAHSG